MDAKLCLTRKDRSRGYLRQALRGDVLYTFFRFKQFTLSFAKRSGVSASVTDMLAQKLLENGTITAQRLQAYEQRLCRELAVQDPVDGLSEETLYRYIQQVRREELGASQVASIWRSPSVAQWEHSLVIDQRSKKQDLLCGCKAVLFAISQPELLPLMVEDLQAAEKLARKIYIAVSPEPGWDLPCRAQLENLLPAFADIRYLQTDGNGVKADQQLQGYIDKKEACLLCYGEEGLLQARGLLIDAVVSCVPDGYCAQAVTNQLGVKRPCVVFVPAGYDITPYVPLTKKTQLSYWHLAKLWEAYGDEIYQKTPAALYRQYPGYFINIYENGADCPEASKDFPVSVLPIGEDTPEQFEQKRAQALERFLSGFENLSCRSAYFDENLQESAIAVDGDPQPGILVHSVRVTQARRAKVMSCPQNTTPRTFFGQLELPETAVVSNFLFFLTAKLGKLYNDLRSDRPREQADAGAGHLDYMLTYLHGKRIETFPLFRKTCIAMTDQGRFLFFNFRLGGGQLQLADQVICWNAQDVDDQTPGAVRIYTPYLSCEDADAPRQTYSMAVGAQRVNFVILGNRLCAVRLGDVLLPSVGVVVSLEAKAGLSIVEKLGLKRLENGYYDPAGIEPTVTLEPPEQISSQVWARVKWAYGGGMTLMRDAEALCDADNMQSWLAREGWMSPLSRQTQESNLHTLAKHPRTAIGTTKNGDLVILVYSGRTWRSTGADYREMCAIARTLYPDIHCLMNVDGGGSAMLGAVHNGSFMELSCPSTSTGSTVGMVRPINTVFYIPGERKQEDEI